MTTINRKVNAKKKQYKKRKVNKSKDKTLSKVIKKEVKSAMSAQSESKQAFHSVGSPTPVYFNSGINSTSDYYRIMPNISKSVDESGRIGDQIRAQTLTVRGYVRLTPILSLGYINTTSLPSLMCRLFVLSLKNKSNWSDVITSASPLNNLLRKGSTTSAYTGVINDIYAPVNREIFTVHHDKVFYLNQNMLYQPAGAGVNMVSSEKHNQIF